jgi:hypothetical protein
MNGRISGRSTGRGDKRGICQVSLFRMSPLKVLALSAVLAALLVSLMPDGEQAMGSGASTARADGGQIVVPVRVPVPARAV